MQYLVFRLEGVEYAVDVSIVETVVEGGQIMPVPSPLECMLGAMDLRGRVIPVIDLKRKLSLPSRGSDGGGIIIVIASGSGTGSEAGIGALVDEVSGVVSIEDADIEAGTAAAGLVWEKCVRGVVRRDGRMIVVIEAEGFATFEGDDALEPASAGPVGADA